MLHDPNILADLALFAQVVELRSFTKAAKVAGVAKSVASRRIAALESYFGVQLIHRTTRNIAPTSEGLRVFEHASKLQKIAIDAQDAAGESSKLVRGTIRLSAAVAFSRLYLAEALASFLGANPEVLVRLVADDRLVNIVDEGFDAAIRISKLGDSSLHARKLAQTRVLVVAAPSYLKERGKPKSPDEFSAHNCLHYELVGRQSEWTFDRSSVRVSGNVTANNGEFLAELACEGVGLVSAPEFMVARDIHAGRLEIVHERPRSDNLGIYAVVPNSRDLPRRTRLLIEFLAQWFRTPRW